MLTGTQRQVQQEFTIESKKRRKGFLHLFYASTQWGEMEKKEFKLFFVVGLVENAAGREGDDEGVSFLKSDD